MGKIDIFQSEGEQVDSYGGYVGVHVFGTLHLRRDIHDQLLKWAKLNFVELSEHPNDARLIATAVLSIAAMWAEAMSCTPAERWPKFKRRLNES